MGLRDDIKNNKIPSHFEILEEFKKADINFIITYNMAGRYYSWGGTFPTLDLIVENTLPNLLRIKRLLDIPLNKFKKLRIGGKISLIGILGMKVLTLWTEVGYRRYEDINYVMYDGYKIISKRDLIDTIKYEPVHTEIRAKLALEKDVFKNEDIALAVYRSIKS